MKSLKKKEIPKNMKVSLNITQSQKIMLKNFELEKIKRKTTSHKKHIIGNN